MTTVRAEERFTTRVTWQRVLLLFAAGAVAVMTEMMIPSIIDLATPLMDISRLVLGVFVLCLALNSANQDWRLPWQRPVFGIVLAFLVCRLAGRLDGVAWPNSGDEHSYLFLADTFLGGRL
jgi:hypothetical protein